MAASTLIFAIGNESRGDDALAPLLAREISNYLNNINISEEVEILEEFQLQIEHAMDMKDRQRVLLIDAGMDTLSPFAFYRLKASDESVLYSHALEPKSLLKVYQQFYQESPPETFVLCIRGASFELGEPLSPEAEKNLAAALSFAETCLLELDTAVWGRYTNA